MAQSLSKIYLHIIFSTRNRHPGIVEKIQPGLYAYMATVLKSWDCPAIIIAGMPDHAHILSLLSKNYNDMFGIDLHCSSGDCRELLQWDS